MQFPTKNASADVLYPMVWEAVLNLESSGFRVVSFLCDGASANRKFYSIHGSSHKTANPYSDDPNREIFSFADVPHLIKTTRNCFSNSFAHANTRPLWVSCVYSSLSLTICIVYCCRNMESILVGLTWKGCTTEIKGENQD